MVEIDINQFLGKDDSEELCRIRQHPNRKVLGINGMPASLFSRDHCSWPLTYSYLCPDCGAQFEAVWHNTTNVSITR